MMWWKNEKYNGEDVLAAYELLRWETNQMVEVYTGVPLEMVRELRREFKEHNRHDVDDEEYGNEEW